MGLRDLNWCITKGDNNTMAEDWFELLSCQRAPTSTNPFRKLCYLLVPKDPNSIGRRQVHRQDFN